MNLNWFNNPIPNGNPILQWDSYIVHFLFWILFLDAGKNILFENYKNCCIKSKATTKFSLKLIIYNYPTIVEIFKIMIYLQLYLG